MSQIDPLTNKLCDVLGKPIDPETVVNVWCIYEYRAKYNCDYHGMPQQEVDFNRGLDTIRVQAPIHGPWFSCFVNFTASTPAEFARIKAMCGRWYLCDKNTNVMNPSLGSCSTCESWKNETFFKPFIGGGAFPPCLGGVMNNGVCGKWYSRQRLDYGREGRDFYAQFFRLVIHSVKTSELNAGWTCPNPPNSPDPGNVMDPMAGPHTPPTLAAWQAMGVKCPNCYKLCPCVVPIQGACGAGGQNIRHMPGGFFDPGGEECTPGLGDKPWKFCVPWNVTLNLAKVFKRPSASALTSSQRAHYGSAGMPFVGYHGDHWECYKASQNNLGDVSKYQFKQNLTGQVYWRENCRECAHDLVIAFWRCGEGLDGKNGSCASILNGVNEGKIFFRRITSDPGYAARKIFRDATADGANNFTFLAADKYCYEGCLINTPSTFQLHMCRWYNYAGSGRRATFMKNPTYLSLRDYGWIANTISTGSCCDLDLVLGGIRDDGVSGEGGTNPGRLGKTYFGVAPWDGCKTDAGPGEICNINRGRCCHPDGTCTSNMSQPACVAMRLGGIASTWTGNINNCGPKTNCPVWGGWLALLFLMLGRPVPPRGNIGCPQPSFPCCYSWHDTNGDGKKDCSQQTLCDCNNGTKAALLGIPAGAPAGQKKGRPVGGMREACGNALPLAQCKPPVDLTGACCDKTCRRVGQCGGGLNVERSARRVWGGGCEHGTFDQCFQKARAEAGHLDWASAASKGWSFTVGGTCATDKADFVANPTKIYCLPIYTDCASFRNSLADKGATKIIRYKFQWCDRITGVRNTEWWWDFKDEVDWKRVVNDVDVNQVVGRFYGIKFDHGNIHGDGDGGLCAKLVEAYNGHTFQDLCDRAGIDPAGWTLARRLEFGKKDAGNSRFFYKRCHSNLFDDCQQHLKDGATGKHQHDCRCNDGIPHAGGVNAPV